MKWKKQKKQKQSPNRKWPTHSIYLTISFCFVLAQNKAIGQRRRRRRTRNKNGNWWGEIKLKGVGVSPRFLGDARARLTAKEPSMASNILCDPIDMHARTFNKNRWGLHQQAAVLWRALKWAVTTGQLRDSSVLKRRTRKKTRKKNERKEPSVYNLEADNSCELRLIDSPLPFC